MTMMCMSVLPIPNISPEVVKGIIYVVSFHIALPVKHITFLASPTVETPPPYTTWWEQLQLAPKPGMKPCSPIRRGCNRWDLQWQRGHKDIDLLGAIMNVRIGVVVKITFIPNMDELVVEIVPQFSCMTKTFGSKGRLCSILFEKVQVMVGV